MVDDPEDETPPQHGTRREFLKTTATAAAAVAIGACGGDDTVSLSDAAPDGGTADADSGAPDTSVPDTATDVAPPPVVDPELTPEALALFELGVASGDVTHDEAVIWTRYAGSTPLVAAVWEMNGDGYERLITEGAVAPAPGGFVHVTVGGLSGGRRYRYAFFEIDSSGARMARSPIGRFRAALAPGQMENLLLGACSCTRNGRAFDTLERAGARDDIDVFLLLGDTTYNDGALSLDAHRARWTENFRTDGYRATRAATSLLATWDDHEVRDNFHGEDSELEDGRRAFFENLPLRRDSAFPNRMWKSIRWGDTAEVFVLDCRGERRPSTVGLTDEYISPEQMDWLKGALLASTSVFKIILNSVPIACFPNVFDFAADDRWEGYPRQRTEILAHIDDNGIGGVMWVAGDFHLASAQRVDSAGRPGENQIEILAGPGANTGNPGAFLLRTEPRFDFSTTTNNYTTLELIPATSTIRVSWIDGRGSTFEVREYVV
jgi:alkaline phosphatase D